MTRARIGISTVVLVVALCSAGAAALLQRDGAAITPSAPGAPTTEGRGSISQSAGGVTIVEAGPGAVRYEISAAAWMRVKDARRSTCFQFDVERTATETTITAYCAAGERAGQGWASFEVESTVWDGDFGEGVDSCRRRQNMKRDPVFTCTVQNPDAALAEGSGA